MSATHEIKDLRSLLVLEFEPDDELNAIIEGEKEFKAGKYKDLSVLKGKVDRSEPLADNVIVDVNKNGVAIGIEILLPEQDSKIQELISRAFKIVA